MIHVDESYFLSSYSASIVQTLQTEIEAIVKLFEPSFLPNSQVNLTRFRECSYHLSNRIEKLLINQSELESSYEFLVVFKHMLEKKDILRPDSYVHKIAKRDRHLNRQKS